MVLPVVMHWCESKTIKKTEGWRTDAFELCCWRRLLRVSWTARRSNQSILKEINPEYSLKGLILKLKLQYFGYLMQRAARFPPSSNKTSYVISLGRWAPMWQQIRHAEDATAEHICGTLLNATNNAKSKSYLFSRRSPSSSKGNTSSQAA